MTPQRDHELALYFKIEALEKMYQEFKAYSLGVARGLNERNIKLQAENEKLRSCFTAENHGEVCPFKRENQKLHERIAKLRRTLNYYACVYCEQGGSGGGIIQCSQLVACMALALDDDAEKKG